MPPSVLETKLFIQEVDSKKRVRLKKDNFAQLLLNTASDTLLTQIVFWNKNGIFYKPINEIVDTIYDDSGRKKDEMLTFSYFISDTIKFSAFENVQKIGFRKNLKFRNSANALLFTIGGELLLLPVLLHPLINGDYKSFGLLDFVITGSGAIITVYAWKRLKKLQKLKYFPMNKYEFMIE